MSTSRKKKWGHIVLNFSALSVSTLQSLYQGIICSSLCCPQWCDAGGVGGIIVLFSLISILLWVGKRCSELICILRLQTDQWLLSKGVIYSGSSLAILILYWYTPAASEVCFYTSAKLKTRIFVPMGLHSLLCLWQCWLLWLRLQLVPVVWLVEFVPAVR